MKVAIYAGYSSDNQRDASIADQIRICREFAARQGWSVIQEFTDHAISDATLLRAGFEERRHCIGFTYETFSGWAHTSRRRFSSAVSTACTYLSRTVVTSAVVAASLAWASIPVPGWPASPATSAREVGDNCKASKRSHHAHLGAVPSGGYVAPHSRRIRRQGRTEPGVRVQGVVEPTAWRGSCSSSRSGSQSPT